MEQVMAYRITAQPANQTALTRKRKVGSGLNKKKGA